MLLANDTVEVLVNLEGRKIQSSECKVCVLLVELTQWTACFKNLNPCIEHLLSSTPPYTQKENEQAVDKA